MMMKAAGRFGASKPTSVVHAVRGAAVMVAALAGTPAGAQPQGSSPATEPLTAVGPGLQGYLADPQPIHLAPGSQPGRQYLSGTTTAVIAGVYPVRLRSFGWAPITVNADGVQDQITAAGATFATIQNTNIFQDDQGGWHAAVGVDVRSASGAQHWTVTCHAHPTEPSQDGAPPRAWSANTVLAGSFSDPSAGYYDAKYYEEDGNLYLLYVRNDKPEPDLRNEIVIQPMTSPLHVKARAVVLLTPGDRYGGLTSERYANTPARLVEAPYITRINGKHALVYSTGAYLTSGYKAGVAWSDTLLPATPDARYRKVLAPDPDDVWHEPGRPQVLYLLQSETPRWPNFTGDDVIGPGVAAAVRGPRGAFWLYFNGFAPGDMPTGPDGQVLGTHRRPFAVLLRTAVPTGQSVADASDAELASWMQPVTR